MSISTPSATFSGLVSNIKLEQSLTVYIQYQPNRILSLSYQLHLSALKQNTKKEHMAWASKEESLPDSTAHTL